MIYFFKFRNYKKNQKVILLSYIVDIILYNDKIISLKFYYSYNSYNIAIVKNNIPNILNVTAINNS